MKSLRLLLLACLLLGSRFGFAQCDAGMVEVIVTITTDSWPSETSWTLASDAGVVYATGGGYTAQATAYSSNVCVPETACLSLSIVDSYGDGIIAPGGYSISINGDVSNGTVTGHGNSHHYNCPSGTFCSTAFELTDFGTYTASLDNTWYVYTATETGTYNISTCGLNTCDTRLYVYANCNMDYIDDGPPGTYTYNDDADCGTQSDLNVVLVAGTTYYIRIGDGNNDCTGDVFFNFNYVGPVQGCTDVSACNFNPMAAQDDGSCLYYPDSNCIGPDLVFDSLAFVNSLYLLTHTTASCDIEEGCVLDYGTRYCLTFSSKIDNIGLTDYYIGNPSANPQMFNTTNCHNHTHYNAYGDYRLYDMQGNMIPAGHKNGFCVMDLCGSGQYNCGDMGISAGCYDEYGAGTQCQWIDITDIPTGDYRMVILVNPFNMPDALGRYEINTQNNALGICIHITHNETGAPQWEIIDGCELFVDCMGVTGGSSVMDCNGECNGTALWGDVYNDDAITVLDTQTYMDIMATSSGEVTTCNDLSGNGQLTIYDAALMQWCHHQAPIMDPNGVMHQQCSFPRNVVNPNEMTGLAISGINLDEHYIDIELTSPDASIIGYQFGISGMVISGVESLVDEVEFPHMLDFNAATNQVMCLSAQDSVIDRQDAPRQLVRVYYSGINASVICIDPVVDIVNRQGERTTTYIYGNCVSTVGVNTLAKDVDGHMLVQPNPAQNQAMIRFIGDYQIPRTLIVRDDIGREVQRIAVQQNAARTMQVDFSGLSQGVYTITSSQEDKTILAVRFVKL